MSPMVLGRAGFYHQSHSLVFNAVPKLTPYTSLILPAVHNSYFYVYCMFVLPVALLSFLSLIYSYCITCPLLLCWSVSYGNNNNDDNNNNNNNKGEGE